MRLCLGLISVAVAVVGLAACGGGTRSPICTANDSLRAALRAVDAARSADSSGDSAAVDREMNEVERLLGVARGNLAGATADPDTAAAARAMLEAANYLQFMVDDSRASGTVDFPIAQFAAREVNRAGSGAGGAPLNC
ncbi:MAG: hypothetical protein AABZ33_05235 [Chloroflexota bacterium]